MQNNNTLLLSFICMFTWLSLANAQDDINFTTLTTRDGLSSNNVNAILKDRYGFMWFATDDGLDRFDGANFKVYRKKTTDSTSLQANEILSLHEDKDGNLWVGTSGGSLSLYNRKKDAFINFPAKPLKHAIRNNVIMSLCSDFQGKLWIGHFDGINIMDKKTQRITDFTPGNKSRFTKTCNVLFEDSKHRIWIGTSDGLFLYIKETNSLTPFLYSANDPASLSDNHVLSITEDKDGTIWVGTNNGLNMLAGNGKEFTRFKHIEGNPQTLNSNFIYSIAVDDANKLWIGTSKGLNIQDTKTKTITGYNFDPRNTNGLSSNNIRSVYLAKEGICWIGTFLGGISKYDKNLNLFNLVQSNPFDKQGLNAPIVTSFAEAKDGNVFVGTDGGGLSLFDPKTKLFQQINIQSRRPDSKRLSIITLTMSGNNQLLIGTFGDGYFMYDQSSGKYAQLLRGTKNTDINSNHIYCVKEDKKGNKWVGTNGNGIFVLGNDNKVLFKMTPRPTLSNDINLPINGYIRDIVEAKNGDMWIATHGGGIAVYNPSSQKFKIFTTENSKLPNDKVLTLLEDRQGNIWAGTFGGGLGLFNRKTNEFISYSEKDGLNNNNIYKIIEDSNGLLWISTNKGLSSFDTDSKKINNYSYHNGIQHNIFILGSGLRLRNGDLFFGGHEGFNYFNPSNLKKNNAVPPVIFTDLKISNRSVVPSEDGPVKENIITANEINLDYKQNFALSFVGLNYTAPEQNQYEYKLEGFDKEWINIGNASTVSFTNIDPGKYVFRVRASNNNGVWNTKGTSIKIYVHPPFWRTIYAYILYTLIIVGTLIYFRHRGIEKIRRKYILEQERFHAEQERKETERIHELDQLKLKFLTNLSHEFRTPISLILGPVDNLIAQEKNNAFKVQLNMIKRNGKRLLNLVNQLLDFRKMEEQELKLQPKDGELIFFVRDVFDSFQDLSERKKIDFSFTSTIEHFHTQFDHDKIERILFNLLSNAFKFTLEGGSIHFEVEKKESDADNASSWISMIVRDSGIGIPQDKMGVIFERFFQNTTEATILNQGSGIGLSITKEFVKMHGGTIEVMSEVEKGATFIVQLPFVESTASKRMGEILTISPINENEAIEQAENKEDLLEEGTTHSSIIPSILLVEDNDDFRFYLKENLRLQYKVFEATNGIEGWQKALSLHPTLIVSDISMPQMDGIQLCKKIKADKRTSHIPVILLTALADEENQIKGLKTGASDYITKPFNFEVLNAKVKNLLLLNDTLKNTYTKRVEVLTPKIKTESSNDKLIQKIVLYIEDNLTDTQLSVETLSRHVGMSRGTLYSKLLELTGQTPVEFIRSVKLDKAAQMLEKSELTIAEVAYSVGFSTPNYFAKSFKAKFNMLPSEYIAKKKKTS
ncbi:hybrid sensor histidine kinase/response regulator transcription factor [Lacibacter sediminis]|uniref:histidine kinase n=1 Tax=Lacibacter sediminis TaxID=2760713 RepID=A0A7G5XLX7_9BACT|nr:two-component regulator propeller domain-containing protein [Lacibacter sediminis]QNA46480.1 response regulator [Lacibacter sediminis]